MGFMKYGDGTIVSVLKDEDELTDEQKKTVKKLSTKQSVEEADASEIKVSEK